MTPRKITIRIFIGFGGDTPKPFQVLTVNRDEFYTEMQYLYVEHNRVPFTIAFAADGDGRVECIVVIRKPERRKL